MPNNEKRRDTEKDQLLPAVRIKPIRFIHGGDPLSAWTPDDWVDGLLHADEQLKIKHTDSLNSVHAPDTRENLGAIMFQLYEGLVKFHEYFPGVHLGPATREDERIPDIYLTTRAHLYRLDNQNVSDEELEYEALLSSTFLSYDREGNLYVSAEALAAKAGRENFLAYGDISDMLANGKRVVVTKQVNPMGSILLSGAEFAAYHLYALKYGATFPPPIDTCTTLEEYDRHPMVAYTLLAQISVALAAIDAYAKNHPDAAAAGNYINVTDDTVQYLRLRLDRAWGPKFTNGMPKKILADLQSIRSTLDARYAESCAKRNIDPKGLEKQLGSRRAA